MNAGQAENSLFGDALCCVEYLPLQFQPQTFEEADIHHIVERAESLLRMIAHLDDPQIEDSEDRSKLDISIHRMEAKLQLSLEMLGTLIARTIAIPPARQIRWSRRGLSWEQETPVPENSTGFIELQLLPWLPLLLKLSCRVLFCHKEDSVFRLWLDFEPLPVALESALERHLFRCHRRAVASSRFQH